MLASWVKDSTTTTGTGTITLAGSPASGYIGFDDAFSSGDTVNYTIVDGNNRETGVGTLTSGASWTLSRDLILETLSSGTYSRWPGTGISLSGSATVGIAPNANNVFGGPKQGLFSATQYDICDDLSALGSNYYPPIADYIYYGRVLFRVPRVIGRLGTKPSTTDAGSTVVRAGIYNSGPDGLPKTRLCNISIDATSAAFQTQTFTAIYCPPGYYWFALVSDSGTADFFWYTTSQGSNSFVGVGAGAAPGSQSAEPTTLIESYTAADLPTTATPSSANRGYGCPGLFHKPS